MDEEFSSVYKVESGEEVKVIAGNCVVIVRHADEGIEVCVNDADSCIGEPGISFVVPGKEG